MCADRDAFQEVENAIDAFIFRRADQRDGRAEFGRQCSRIDVTAAAAKIIGHVQDHQRRQSESQDRRGKNEMPLQVGAIENQQHGVRTCNAPQLALQYVMRNLFVFRTRSKTVDARQIHQHHVLRVDLGAACVLLDRDTGEVRDFLPQSGKPVEKCGFT